MKNMIKRLMALAAALTIVLSLAAVTGSAAYLPDENPGAIMPLWEDDIDDTTSRD